MKFSYENGGNFIELDTVALDKGKATYKWDNPEQKEYEIKAEYLGDSNYDTNLFADVLDAGFKDAGNQIGRAHV